jgi:hypothetical protein
MRQNLIVSCLLQHNLSPPCYCLTPSFDTFGFFVEYEPPEDVSFFFLSFSEIGVCQKIMTYWSTFFHSVKSGVSKSGCRRSPQRKASNDKSQVSHRQHGSSPHSRCLTYNIEVDRLNARRSKTWLHRLELKREKKK